MHNQELRQGLVKHLPELQARARKLCRSSHLAADILQETAERALRFEDHYQPGTNVRAYLYQVLFHVFVSHCRKQKQLQSAAIELLGQATWGSQESHTDLPLTRSTQLALCRLHPDFRRVIELVDLQELPYRDAAEQMNIPVGTVMSRLFRARRQLRESLALAA